MHDRGCTPKRHKAHIPIHKQSAQGPQTATGLPQVSCIQPCRAPGRHGPPVAHRYACYAGVEARCGDAKKIAQRCDDACIRLLAARRCCSPPIGAGSTHCFCTAAAAAAAALICTLRGYDAKATCACQLSSGIVKGEAPLGMKVADLATTTSAMRCGTRCA